MAILVMTSLLLPKRIPSRQGEATRRWGPRSLRRYCAYDWQYNVRDARFYGIGLFGVHTVRRRDEWFPMSGVFSVTFMALVNRSWGETYVECLELFKGCLCVFRARACWRTILLLHVPNYSVIPLASDVTVDGRAQGDAVLRCWGIR